MSMRDRFLNLMVIIITIGGSYLSVSYMAYAFRHPEKSPARCMREWRQMLSFQ